MVGLFHACFVFERVCQFYARYIQVNGNDEDTAYRFRLLLACTRIAARSLASIDGYEPFGRALLDGIITRTDRLSRLGYARLQQEETAAIVSHFASWCERNPALAEQNRFTFPD